MNIQALLRLKILAAQATSKEPVGPALGQLGVPIMDFCNKFNSLTSRYLSDAYLNIVVYSYGNQKYDFIVKFPDFSFFIKKCFSASITIKTPGYISFPMDKFFYVTPFMLYEILFYFSFYGLSKSTVFYNEYKRLVNSLKSSGLIIFSH